MVANDQTVTSAPAQFRPNATAAAKMDPAPYLIDEGILPFAKPVIKKASSVHKAIKYPTMGYPVPKKVLQTEDGQLYEEGLEIKDARFGKVHRIYRLEQQENGEGPEVFVRSNEKLAVKKLHKRAILHNREKAENPLHEIATLQFLSTHYPETTPYVDCCADSETIYLITPYFSSGDLLDYIFMKQKLHQSFSLLEVKEMFRQLTQQVAQIHRLGLAHRDLSLENVLFDRETNSYSIIDYGMSLRLRENPLPASPSLDESDLMMEVEMVGGCDEEKENCSMISEDSTVSCCSSSSSSSLPPVLPPSACYERFAKLSKYFTCGKTHYMAPEIWTHQPNLQLLYSDIWSLGVIFFMVMMFQAPFASSKKNDQNYQFYLQRGLNLEELILQLNEGRSFFADKAVEDHQQYRHLLHLIQRMLHPDVQQRLTIEEVLNHPFFQ